MPVKDIIGYVGGALLGIQLIPQIFKACKTNSTQDLSFNFMFLNVFGLSCMTVYGLLNADMPLYIPAMFSIVNTLILICLKIYFENIKIKDRHHLRDSLEQYQ